MMSTHVTLEQILPTPAQTEWRALSVAEESAPRPPIPAELPASTPDVRLDGENLSHSQIVGIIAGGQSLALDSNPAVRARLESRCHPDEWRDDSFTFCDDDGFVDLPLPSTDTGAEGRRHLIRKCACDNGPRLAPTAARAALLMSVQRLAQGHPEVRLDVVERLVEMLNLDLLPLIAEPTLDDPSLAAALAGEGWVSYRGHEMPAAEAWAVAGIEPLVLRGQERQVLETPATVLASLAARVTIATERLARAVEIASALAFEAVRANRLTSPTGQPVQRPSGRHLAGLRIRRLSADSEWIRDEVTEAPVEPAELHCAPHSIGLLHDALRGLTSRLEASVNRMPESDPANATSDGTDTPETTHEPSPVRGFRLGVALDTLKAAASCVADQLQRQTEILLDPEVTGLPWDLIVPEAEEPPRGFTEAHQQIQALVRQALELALPTVAPPGAGPHHDEDYLARATQAARQSLEVIELARRCCAIQLLAACQTLDLRRLAAGEGSGGPERLGATRPIYDEIRTMTSFVGDDRPLHTDILAVAELIGSGNLVKLTG